MRIRSCLPGRRSLRRDAAAILFLMAYAIGPSASAAEESATALAAIKESGISCGVLVHIGNGDGAGTVALARSGKFVVHRLVPDASKLDAVRAAIREGGAYGSVSAEHWGNPELPYATHLANVLVVEGGLDVPEAEVTRVIAPRGLGLVLTGGTWKKVTKPFPAGMDGWTQAKHAADGNPVSKDDLPFRKVPNSIRWVAGDLMAGSSAIRLAEGRVFISFGNRIQARDAFNGVLQWQGDVGGNPIVVGGRIYSGGNVCDAATGKSVLRIETGQCHETIVTDGMLVARDTETARGYDTGTGKQVWTFKARVLPRQLEKFRDVIPATRLQHLVAGGGRVYLTGFEPRIVGPEPKASVDPMDASKSAEDDDAVKTDDKKAKEPPPPAFRVYGLNPKTGKQEWLYENRSWVDDFTIPVLYADGTLLLITRKGYLGIDTRAKDSAWFVNCYGGFDEKSKTWSPALPLDGRGGLPSAVLYIDGLIWIGGNVGDEKGPFPKDKEMSKCWAGIDPKSGKFARWIGYPPAQVQWSGRCYADIGAPDCILAQTMEIVTVDGKTLEHIRGVRGQCGIGFTVGHNAVFTPPNVCIYCYPMIRGAVSYEVPDRRLDVVDDARRLEKGPAFGKAGGPEPEGRKADSWPMYRGGHWRNDSTRMALEPGSLSVKWEAPIGGRCTQAVIDNGKVVTAVINDHRVVCVDEKTGKIAWQYTAGARIDTSPTLSGGLCLFGAHDGYVYCLRLDDGALVWRFNAAPRQRRIVSGDQICSAWPVVGSVLCHKGVVYATAGLMTSLDGGIHFWALDPATGETKFHRELTSIRGQKATILPNHWYVHQEDMLNNILLAQGDEIRLYDQHGGWELSARTGELVGQSQAVPQPGWPKGRLTPGDFKTVDRWPWCGWDRITMIYLLRGEEPGFGSGVGMDPRNRWADWYKGMYFVFPDRGKTGIQLHKGTLNPTPWVLPGTLEGLCDPKVWRATPDYTTAADKLWQSQRPGTGVNGMVFAGDTLWVAGEKEKGTVIHAVSMSDGKMTEACTLEGQSSFDSLSAADGRLFVVSREGKLACLGR